MAWKERLSKLGLNGVDMILGGRDGEQRIKDNVCSIIKKLVEAKI